MGIRRSGRRVGGFYGLDWVRSAIISAPSPAPAALVGSTHSPIRFSRRVIPAERDPKMERCSPLFVILLLGSFCQNRAKTRDDSSPIKVVHALNNLTLRA